MGEARHNLVISDDVRIALGEVLSDQLLAERALVEVTCAVCQRDISLAAGESAAVSLEQPINRVFFTHPACMPSRVIVRHRTGPDHLPAHAITFAVPNDEGTLEPYLAFETTAILWEVPQGSPDPADSTIAMYLQRGFALVAGPLSSQPLPSLPGWAMKADDAAITVWDEAGVVAYTAATEDVKLEWIHMLDARTHCNVLTGTGLGLSPGTFVDDLESAISAGRTVGAKIPLVGGEREHPA